MARHLVAVPIVAAVCFAAVPAPRPVIAVAAIPSPPTPSDTASGCYTSERIASDPVAFLDACRGRYSTDVRGYTALLLKQERVQGKLFPPEEIRVAVRESPFAVCMLWTSGARKVGFGAIEGTLFLAGQNDGRMKVWRPDAALKILDVSPADSSARAAARYSIAEGGLYHAVDRTFRGWSAARKAGHLHVEYLGPKAIPELDGRVCHVLRRTVEPAEVDPFLNGEPIPDATVRSADAFAQITVLIDAETWLQTGAELKRSDGELIGRYLFRDVTVNPKFTDEQFTIGAFRRRPPGPGGPSR